MKPLLLSLLLAVASLHTLQAQITAPAVPVHAETDARYLKGAVPVIDDYATITREVTVRHDFTADQLNERLSQWLDRCMKDERIRYNQRLEAKQPQTLQQSVSMEITFSKSFIAHDFADLAFVLTLDTREPGHVRLLMSHIAYRYNDGDKMVKYTGEDIIADPIALNKKGQIYRGYKKFRIKTIDLMDELAASLQKELQ